MKVTQMVRGEGPRVEGTEFCRGDTFVPLDDHRECDRSVVLGPGLTYQYAQVSDMVTITQGALVRCSTCLFSYVVAGEWSWADDFVEEDDGS